MAPSSPEAAIVGQPRVERVRPGGLDDQRAAFEFQAEHVIVGEQRAGERARFVSLHVHGVRMFVDEIADLVHVAFGQNPALVDQQDVRGHRLDLVKDVARHDDTAARAAPLLDQPDGLAACDRIHSRQRLVENQQFGLVGKRLRQS